MGLDLTPAGLLMSILVSGVGLGLFLYGKRAARIPQLVTGLVLMGMPLFVTGALAMLALSAALVGGMWALARFGA